MVRALEFVMKTNGWDRREALVWVDCSAIPQSHPGIQGLAIRSVTAYASTASAFIIVAPRCTHSNLGTPCDVKSYQRRVWCRAEQACHSLCNGTEHMWLADEHGCAPINATWFEDALRVFQGELTCCRLSSRRTRAALCRAS